MTTNKMKFRVGDWCFTEHMPDLPVGTVLEYSRVDRHKKLGPGRWARVGGTYGVGNEYTERSYGSVTWVILELPSPAYPVPNAKKLAAACQAVQRYLEEAGAK